jgi:hypothetical protein
VRGAKMTVILYTRLITMRTKGPVCVGGMAGREETKTTGVFKFFFYFYFIFYLFILPGKSVYIKWHRVGGGRTFFSSFIFLIIGLRRGSLSHFFLPSMSTYNTVHNSPLGHVPARILLHVYKYNVYAAPESNEPRNLSMRTRLNQN